MTATEASPPDGRRQRWAAHRAARRQELIAAVIATVHAHGPAIDMEQVRRESGIAKQVFYRYFDDKADLYVAVGREVGERIVADVVRAVDAEDEPRARLRAGIEAFLGTVEAEPDLYRFALRSPAATTTAVGDYGQVVGLHVSRLIGDLLRAGGLDSGMAEPWGFAMVGAVRAAAERWLEEPVLSRTALADYLTALLWDGAASAAREAGIDPPLTSGG